MQVHRSIENLPILKNPVLTIGTFDGVHLGHQQILRQIIETAKQIGGESVVFTFHPHPRIALNPDDHGLELIQTLDERIKKLERLGIDHLILFPFTKEFSRLSATEFVRNVLVNQIKIHTLIIGYNHHFGRNREGNFELLKELSALYGFNVSQIQAYSDGSTEISSTKIRTAITEGNVKLAENFLGGLYHFSGKVVKGDGIGSKIGFPTANVETDKLLLIPKQGVFAVKVLLNKSWYNGMMNIGKRPTVSDKGERKVEIHLFEFEDNLYGQELNVYLIDHIRDEKNFKSIDELKEQLYEDEKLCKTILASNTINIKS